MRHASIAALLLAPLMMAASPAAAQDLQPALDPSAIAQGQVLSGMMRGHAERDYARQHAARRAPTATDSRRTCANGRAMVRRGNGDPRLRQLLALCRQGGY